MNFMFTCPEPITCARHLAQQRQSELTKPRGSLGRLEEIAVQLAAWQGQALPKTRPAVAVVFAADHPVTKHGISPYPSAVTRAMLDNFAGLGAAASVLAARAHVPLSVVDVGVERGAEPVSSRRDRQQWLGGIDFVTEPVARLPAGDLRVEDAMSHEVFELCVGAGRDFVTRACDGAKILIPGDMGIGNTTVAAAVCAGILGGDPARWVGAGAGADPEMLLRKQQVVREAVARLAVTEPPLEVLRRVGGREVAALFGAMARALEQRITVIVDGFIATAAALVLCQLEPRAKAGLLFAHRSDEYAHQEVLNRLEVFPLLDLGMRLGEASGALVAFSLVEQACTLHERMATFASSGVPDRE